MPLGRVKAAAFGTWMMRSGGYLRSFGERAAGAAGTGAGTRPRAADAGAGSCADTAAARRIRPKRILIAVLLSCVPVAWAAALPRTGPAERYTQKCGR